MVLDIVLTQVIERLWRLMGASPTFKGEGIQQGGLRMPVKKKAAKKAAKKKKH
jgi:hypothetical protein